MAEKKISVAVVDLSGKEVGKVQLNPVVFGATDVSPQVVKDAVTVYLANRRQATAKTKKRHEIHGTNRKPWRQKGTGRARAGDCKSPIWVGGGTVFGPAGTQNYRLAQNKKAHRLALRSALAEKVNNGLIVVDSFDVKARSTKEFAATLKTLGLEGKKVLIVVDGENENLILSARGIEGVGLVEVGNVAVYDLLHFDAVLVSKDDIKKIEEALQ